MSDDYLPVPIGQLPQTMPSPRDLAKALEHSLAEHVAHLRRERGDVSLPSDVFELVRSLTKSYEVLKDYESAFSKAVKIVKEEMEEELCEAMGDQDGVPNGGMTVPDLEGDVRISVDSPNSYRFDVEQLVQVAIASVDKPKDPLSTDVRKAAYEAIQFLLSMGEFKPQVSKVKANAMELSRLGSDDFAGVLLSSIQKTTAYRGVKFERKESGKK
jgi:hypothetical protein